MSTPSLAERDWSGGVVRYPDPAVEALDARFSRYRIGNAVVERLFTGCRWAEGPVWFGDARCLIWSDIPNNRMLRWNEESGEVSVYRSPSQHSNGNTRDRQGRLVTCEHTGRRVTRTEHDGSITVLMDSFEGKRLSSPNDVVVHSDGSVWFTDPGYGIMLNYEGQRCRGGTANPRLSPRPRFGRGHDRSRRLPAPQWPVLFARRGPPLHCRYRTLPRPGRPLPHPRF